MEAMSLDKFYRSFYGNSFESSQTFSIDALQIADFASLAEVSDQIWSEDVNLQLHATTQISRLLSIERECPATLVSTGVVQRIFSFLMRDGFFDLQYEAAWALVKIFRGSSGSAKAEFFLETVPSFVRLLNYPCDDVCEMAVFALGIVADDCRKYRDLVLSNGVLLPLLKQMEKHLNLGNHVKLSMMRNLTWTLSILCKDISDCSFRQVKLALTKFERLFHSDDVEVQINSCWAICCLAYKVHLRSNLLMNPGLCPTLVEHLLHKSRRVQIPVLLLAALITFEPAHKQTLIENGILGPLWALLIEEPNDKDPKDGDKEIKGQVCLVICGILRGGEHQIQAVIDAKLFDHLVKLLESPHEGLQAKAAEAISTATVYGSPKQMEHLVNVCKIINPICNLLSTPNVNKVEAVLQVLEKVLRAGRRKGSSRSSNPYIELIIGTGCVEKLDKICMGEIKCGPDNYDSAPYILCLLGLNPTDIDI